ncbi:MAG: hypothetical protein CVU62_13835 [Deltaproteobacteria bacterium HGW-Deltaproteobacteria-2]|jgi:hypothetical protein|nr:MAG: hypothetical protein CVU62_13835 [Deltaproteobacteria bacterium HGW-Deltaproteobacteria-2]
MLIHCLIKREGPTTVTLENTKYLFMPIPGSKKGEMTTSVCEVSKQSHIDHLLKLSMYEEYDQEKVEAERALEAKKPDLMKGFSIEKYSEAGYVAVDRRKKPIKIAGENGEWVTKGTAVVPFKSEMEAYTFLQEAVQLPEESKVEDEVGQLTKKKA